MGILYVGKNCSHRELEQGIRALSEQIRKKMDKDFIDNMHLQRHSGKGHSTTGHIKGGTSMSDMSRRAVSSYRDIS